LIPRPKYVQARALATKAVDIRSRARKALLLRLLRLTLLRLKLGDHLKRVDCTSQVRWRAVDDRIDDKMRRVESALVTVWGALPMEILAADERLRVKPA
jgi:hypothetical protein